MFFFPMVDKIEDFRQYSPPDIAETEAGFDVETVYNSSDVYPSGSILACVIMVQSPIEDTSS